jgi:hypothetical protein
MDYETLATDQTIEATIKALGERNIEGLVVNTKEEVLEKIKSLIPAGASVMNGSSTTLQQVGYIDYLKEGKHGWKNLHEEILAEKDPAKQALLRRQSVVSDFYLGSVHAVAQTGELVFGSNSGSQLPHIVYTSQNLIFVVSTKKITPTLEEAVKRLEVHVVPQEDQRMMKASNVHTRLSKELIFRYEQPFGGRKVRVIFVKENLGF